MEKALPEQYIPLVYLLKKGNHDKIELLRKKFGIPEDGFDDPIIKVVNGALLADISPVVKKHFEKREDNIEHLRSSIAELIRASRDFRANDKNFLTLYVLFGIRGGWTRIASSQVMVAEKEDHLGAEYLEIKVYAGATASEAQRVTAAASRDFLKKHHGRNQHRGRSVQALRVYYYLGLKGWTALRYYNEFMKEKGDQKGEKTRALKSIENMKANTLNMLKKY